MTWLKAIEVQPFLAQTKVWKNVNNETILLSEIDARYAGNIVRFLDRKADELADKIDLVEVWVWAAMDAAGTPHRIEDPSNWMRGTSLYKALRKIAADEQTGRNLCEHGWTEDDFCPDCSDDLLADLEERSHQFGHD